MNKLSKYSQLGKKMANLEKHGELKEALKFGVSEQFE